LSAAAGSDFAHPAQIRRDRMRRLGDERTQLELAADLQKFFGNGPANLKLMAGK